MLKHALTAAIVLATLPAQAKTAIELFESVSNSVVVVYAKNSQGKTQSLGSGVAFAAGEVVTNCHVIEKSDSFTVKHGNSEYPATLKHTDHDRDVCSLTVAGLTAPVAELGSTKPLKIGQKVFAIGAPKGLELTLSEGIISSLREVKSGRYLQISAPISPGSSGGGLFDEEGRLIGLPTFYLSEGQQLNFAVPVEWIKELSQRQAALPKSGESSLSWLNKAIQLEQQKNWRGLLAHTQTWTKTQPSNSVAWFALGTAYDNSGQTTKAIESYQQALRIDPEYIATLINLGLAYGEVDQTAKAIDALTRALRINPEHANAWINLGIAYKGDGQRDKVTEVYRRLKKIDPKQADEFFRKYVLP